MACQTAPVGLREFALSYHTGLSVWGEGLERYLSITHVTLGKSQ
ncbi:MAG: hypothetical protein UZ15_CFX003002321 [Chloroflexi bacterium OLB15]|nr:MAG: hypothetical protein UZ15_CFX003002321 [Chloroflexi bacterium OLB15]